MAQTFEELQAQYDEIVRIATTPDKSWSPVDRLAAIVLRTEVHRRKREIPPDVQSVTFDHITGDYVARKIGTSRPTAGNSLRRIEEYGKLINRDSEGRRWVNNRYEPIPRKVANLANGDRAQTVSLTHVHVTWPAELPELKETERDEKAKANAKKYRDNAEETKLKLAEAERKLAAIECPSCKAVGKWHAVCGECGTVISTIDQAQQSEDERIADDTLQAAADYDKVKVLPPLIGDKEFTAEASTDEGIPISASQPTSAQAEESELGKSFTRCETLTGADTVDWLTDVLGDNCFCLIHKPGDELGHGNIATGKEPINTRNEWGDELSWPDNPVSAAAAKLHMERGGNVGLLGGRNQAILLDVDKGFADFLKLYPSMDMQGRFYRDNATDRAKLLILLHEGESLPSKVYEGDGRKVEVLSTGKQGVIGGTHQSGELIRFLPPETLDVYHAAQIGAMCEAFTGAQQAQAQTITPKRTTPTRRSAAGAVKTYAEQAREAIAWWNPQHHSEVQTMLRTCPHKGGYVSIRPDDNNPSTRESRDGYEKATWRDYGANETLDAFEMYCRLKNLDKKRFIFEVINEWRAAHGQELLPDLQRAGRGV